MQVQSQHLKDIWTELQQLTSTKSFSSPSTTFNTFLVNELQNHLYVGATNAIFVLNLTSVAQDPFVIKWNVTETEHQACVHKGKMKTKCHNYIRILKAWNETHLFACGTYAFDPRCAYINILDSVKISEDRVQGVEKGRGKCPFGPKQPFAATLADGVLYAATAIDFQGKDPAVVKNIGRQEKIRTEDSVKWLSDPEFVASTFIRADIGTGDDDKLYFFFSETAREFEYYKVVRVPRVARVCKGDIGGQKTLQKRWTSFLKARLVCSDENNEMFFDKIHDVFTLQSDNSDTKSTVFYGVFSTRWDNQDVSAVCAYDITDVQKAFDGQYMEYKRESDKWGIYRGEVPDPRPGTCITRQLKEKGYNTSLDLPDSVLMFVRDHLLMADCIHPIGRRPLLVMRDTLYSKILVKKMNAGTEVLYLGTESGHLHKAVRRGSKTHVVEDYAVFESAKKVLNIALNQEFVYVGSSNLVVQLPAVNCSRYTDCEGCLLARDPSCSWDVQKLECVPFRGKTAQRFLQDVEYDHLQTNTLCKTGKDISLPMKVVPVVNGTTVFLQCEPSSAWSTCHWTTPNGNLSNNDKAKGIAVKAALSSIGNYRCICIEDKVQALQAFYSLEFGSSIDPRKETHSYNYLLMFFFLIFGSVIGAFACKFVSWYCSKKKAPGSSHKEGCTDTAGGTTVHSLDSTDEIRPLTISQKRESDLNGTSEKDEDCVNMDKEVNGMNVGPLRNHTISIISCQDETSI
ncbi:semaphorin-4F isoform X2 [Stegostoma tigrinum]|uniref:semaphorin-4F isoform X2 n=1 Tax=Stegostoma tigrinum TaxID=3053191 RepID=UPI0028707085|nr:semaphorin-4F isoform X2 [Stegostoma tigrinum]